MRAKASSSSGIFGDQIPLWRKKEKTVIKGRQQCELAVHEALRQVGIGMHLMGRSPPTACNASWARASLSSTPWAITSSKVNCWSAILRVNSFLKGKGKEGDGGKQQCNQGADSQDHSGFNAAKEHAPMPAPLLFPPHGRKLRRILSQGPTIVGSS